MEDLVNRVTAYLEKEKCAIVADLKALVKIPSVKGAQEPGAPNGAACAEALYHSAGLFKKQGFSAEVFENSGYALARFGSGDKTIGLFSHCDVVPAGEDWTLTSPFSPVEIGGFLVGRGAEDNKSGVIASLYAMRAIKELDIPLKSRLLAFVGSDEESGMSDAEAFSKEQPMPNVSIVPDNEFPVFVGEKGVCRFAAISGGKLSQVLNVCGGTAFNVILDKAEITLKYTAALEEELARLTAENSRVQIEKRDGELVLTAKGVSKHASAPEGACNAMLCAAEVFKQCKTLPGSDRKIFETVSELLADTYGRPFGIDQTDRNFGRLTCANGIVKLEDGRLWLSFDVRFGTETDPEEMRKKIDGVLRKKGWEMAGLELKTGFDNGGETKIVDALMDAYRQISKNKEATPLYSAGATYAAHLETAFSVGTCAPYKTEPLPRGLPEGHGGIHQCDEMLHIDGFLEGIKILIFMIIKADRAINS